MIVTLIGGPSYLRLLFQEGPCLKKAYRFPIGMIADPGAASRVANQFLPLLGNFQTFFTAGAAEGLEWFLELLTPFLHRPPALLDLLGGTVDWGFSPPDRLPVEDVLTLTGAASLWPRQEVVLVDLTNAPIFHILQHSTHIASFQPTGFDELLATHFPRGEPFLVHSRLHPASAPQSASSQAQHLPAEVVFHAWREHLIKSYVLRDDTPFVSYGEDEAAFRLFPGASDFHRQDLVETGACLLANQQWRRGQ